MAAPRSRPASRLGSKHARRQSGGNGTAVLKIAFSDGSNGALTIGCHGPGAPPGIFEGIATTKGFTTYYDVPDPVPGVDVGRTNFHVR